MRRNEAKCCQFVLHWNNMELRDIWLGTKRDTAVDLLNSFSRSNFEQWLSIYQQINFLWSYFNFTMVATKRQKVIGLYLVLLCFTNKCTEISIHNSGCKYCCNCCIFDQIDPFLFQTFIYPKNVILSFKKVEKNKLSLFILQK